MFLGMISRVLVAVLLPWSTDEVVSNPQLSSLFDESLCGGEEDGKVVIPVRVTGNFTDPVTLTINTTDATATSPADFIALSSYTVIVTPPARGTVVTIGIVIDGNQEEEEGFRVIIEGPGLNTLVVTVCIIDEEPMKGDLLKLRVARSISVPETETAKIPIWRGPLDTGPLSLAVKYEFGGARKDRDYSAVSRLEFGEGEAKVLLEIPILSDEVNESGETFYVTLIAEGYFDETMNVTILDDDGKDRVLLDFIVSDQRCVSENETAIQVQVGRPDTDTGPLNVSVVYDNGSAKAGSDFSTATAHLQFARDDENVTLLINLVQDEVNESRESFFVTLSAEGYFSKTVQLCISGDTGHFTLKEFTVVGKGCFSEDEEAPHLHVLRPQCDTEPMTVTVEYRDGTARDGSDYTPSVTTLLFAERDKQATLEIPILKDKILESLEDFSLTLHAAGYNSETIRICINDDDNPLEFTIYGNTCVQERVGAIRLHVHRPQYDRGPRNVTVLYLDSTAMSDRDYLTAARTLEFHGNEGHAILEIPIVEDLRIESRETFLVILSAENYANKTIHICIEDDDAPVDFDCNRHGVNCATGTTCPPNGKTCDCSGVPGRTGPDCSIIADNVNGTGCQAVDCGTGGQCVSVNGTGHCHCHPAFYTAGDKICRMKRTTITSCDNNKMTVCMNPFSIYQPLITVSGYTSTHCTARPVPDPDDPTDRIPAGVKGQCITVEFEGNCGRYPSVQQGNDSCHTVSYRIQYNPILHAASDEVIFAKCCLSPNGTVSLSSVYADVSQQLFNKQFAEKFYKARLTLTLANDLPVVGPIPLNQVYRMCLETKAGAFAYLGLVSVLGHNGGSGSSRKVAVTYGTDGCPDESGKSLVHVLPWRVTDTKICMDFKPGYFTTGPASLIYDITYKLCLAARKEDCNLITCGTATRRRRQAVDGSVEEKTSAVVYFIKGSTDETAGSSLGNRISCECTRESSVMFPAVIGVSMVALTLLLVVFAMCIRNTRLT
ncbi:FRAS1-related extracellular matrix protein 2-like isoform X2 [Haliotis asinina]|uniref:FRAS1-related extracellular matrix protein 2-like isoform X2 n=1 Tax=Haliotis asinina TaxID=109174 RepID=UPI003531FE21